MKRMNACYYYILPLHTIYIFITFIKFNDKKIFYVLSHLPII